MSQPIQTIPPERAAGGLLDAAIRDSVGGRAAAAAATALTAAWTTSASRRLVMPAAAAWRALPPAARIRTIAFAGATGMLVHLAMARFGAREPLGALVPALVIVACAMAALCADAVAAVGKRLGP